jgi:hypothetical protein
MKKFLNYVFVGLLITGLSTATYSQPVVSVVHTETVVVTAAELEASATTYVQIVAAPGAEKRLDILGTPTLVYTPGSTPYTTSGQPPIFAVVYGQANGSNSPAFVGFQNSLFGVGEAATQLMLPASSFATPPVPVTGPSTNFVGQGLFLGTNSAPQGGNGTVAVTVTYTIN